MCGYVCAKALQYKLGALAIDLENLPLRSISTNLTIVPANNWLQHGKKQAVALSDRPLLLTCRFVYVEAASKHCSWNMAFWHLTIHVKECKVKIEKRLTDAKTKKMSHVLIEHSVWPVGLLENKANKKEDEMSSHCYSMCSLLQEGRPPVFDVIVIDV